MKTAFSIIIAIITSAICIPRASADETTDILAAYEKVAGALVKDDLAGAKSAATALAASAATQQPAIASHAKELAKSSSLEMARDHFKAISKEAIKLAKGRAGYYVVTCPMAKADWVQSTKQVANPYLGKEMPTCGEIKE
jgi:hypothetical protein